MIFEPLHEAAQRGELLLVDGGLCHWHLRRDGQVTIREIIVLPERQGRGIGRGMLNALCRVPGASSIFAKCPVDLPANGFYRATGFVWEGAEMTRTGRKLNLWRLTL
uniref:Putative acetyltransferase n=1 Tax=viral metagenome TaxID=1070528 RepID=A0A6M3MAF2_9ZZZZ